MTRPLRFLSWQTDLILLDTSIVIDRGDYIVVRTPERRGFYWGNFLLFREGPRPGDLERWSALFDQEITSQQPTRHVAFGWDSPEGEHEGIDQFTDRGFSRARGTDLFFSEPS